ncbi:type II toxin-antitoxin system RelE/ParE family toxin [Azospirillum soli]|uniref:type II toxin-antitoxin system RelE/ParE family toxin n=1 Tax=Azospirillum soli TaxID=1304799 RepID=UPI001AEA28E9|nr:plasmid stabilization system protein ParE [Azospirillum soli]
MKVRYLRSAIRNIEEISQYIRQHNETAALKVGQRIHDVVDLIAERPGLGKPGLFPGTREFKIPNLPYRIIYRVSATNEPAAVLEILRVHHIRRRPVPPDWA